MTGLTWVPGTSETTGHFEEPPVKTIDFANHTCTVNFRNYQNGRTAITLTDHETGEPIATATINLVDNDLDKNEVAINHDCPEAGPALVKAGILEPAHREINYPWGQWPIHRLKKRKLAELSKADQYENMLIHATPVSPP